MKEKRILIVVGEASGDMYGARLVDAIRKQAAFPVQFFGCAGEAMRGAGVEPVVTVEELSVHGIVEVLFHLDSLFDGFRRLVFAADEKKPDLVILIDFPDFNLRLARRLKHLGIRMVYFISPQLWAWRRGRVATLRELIDEVICILPFEEPFYREAGVPASYVGHPLVEMLEVEATEGEFLARFRIDPRRPRIAMLPGSRKNEIRHNLPSLLKTIHQIQSHRSDLQFLLGISSTVGRRFITREIERWQRNHARPVDVLMIEGCPRCVLKYSDVAVVSSGTATLEAALMGTPLVAIYRVNPLSWWVGQKLIDVDYYCLVNLILGRPVVAELYQKALTPKRLEEEIFHLLENPEARRNLQQAFSGLKLLLSTAHSPLARAAEIILSHLETQTTKTESNKLTPFKSTMELGTTT